MSNQLARLRAALAGRYEVEREVGRGGMATVYLARDVRHERPVALKVLRPDLAAALGPERFLREVKIAAALQHPHILPVHDSGDADGLLYYVMPYVEGESLREHLRGHGELPIPDAVRILRDVAGRARIRAALGDSAEAVRLLRQALREGRQLPLLHGLPELADLESFGPYVELMRPRGQAHLAPAN